MGRTVLPPVPTFRRQLRTPAEQACVETEDFTCKEGRGDFFRRTHL